jgi:hypothetical protein
MAGRWPPFWRPLEVSARGKCPPRPTQRPALVLWHTFTYFSTQSTWTLRHCRTVTPVYLFSPRTRRPPGQTCTNFAVLQIFGDNFVHNWTRHFRTLFVHFANCEMWFSRMMRFTFASTLLLTSYIQVYGATCKARNFCVVYIWTYVWQGWKPSLSICCTMFQHWINAEIYPVSQLCVNTLLVTKITLITDGI